MIQKLWVRNFCNLKESVFHVKNQQSFFIFGDNNQGKTSLLQAFFVICRGEAFAHYTLDNLIKFGENEAFLGADFHIESSFYRVYVHLKRGHKIKVFVNDVHVNQSTKLTQFLPCEYISADILHIFQKDAEYRRKDLDKFCTLFFPEYINYFNRYEKLLRQKNRLLKTTQDGQLLLFYNDQLSVLAKEIVVFRKKALSLIASFFNTFFKELNIVDYDQFSFNYDIKRLGIDFDMSCYSDTLKTFFTSSMEKEKAAGFSLIGPQRDDFSLCINGNPCFNYYSRGINRIVSVFYQVAKLHLLGDLFAKRGLLLLDDTFSEVDQTKRRELISFLQKYAQVGYTTTSDSDQDLFNSALRFSIKEGELSGCIT